MQAVPKNAQPPDWALLVVDMQNDFLDKGGYYARRASLQECADWEALSPEQQFRLLESAPEDHRRGARSKAIEQVVANVCGAISTARAANRPIAFVRAAYDRGFDILPPLLSNDPDRRHFPCKPGTWGAEFFGGAADAIREAGRTSERIFEKHTYDAFSNLSLLPFLRETRVSAVVVCGTETHVCVLASAQHAALLGFRTFILEDCVWSANTETANAALSIFRDAYGGTLTLRDLESLAVAQPD